MVVSSEKGVCVNIFLAVLLSEMSIAFHMCLGVMTGLRRVDPSAAYIY